MKAESERGLGSTTEVLARCCGQGPPAAVTSEHYVPARPPLPATQRGAPQPSPPTPQSLPRAAGGAIQSQAGVRRGLPAPHPPTLGSMFTFSFGCQQRGSPRGPQTGCGGWEGLVSCPCPPHHCSVARSRGEAPRPPPSVDPARPKHIYLLSEQLIPPRASRILERRFENSDPSL